MTDRPERTAGLDISPVDDGYVVYDPENDLVHYLNPTAAITLELCNGRQTVAEIATFLRSTFASSGEDVAAAVASCVEQLRELGLLQPVPAVAVPAVPAPAVPAPAVPASAVAAPAGR
jgi:PqqD family protein of HPr-rel-A system